MGYSLEQFSTECRRILKQDPGVEGRQQVCALVQQVLKDENFIKTHLGDNAPERKSCTKTRSSASAFSAMSTRA